MHPSSIIRMQWFVKEFLSESRTQQNKKLKVLDIGSYDVNGTYRDLFEEDKFQYFGLDMEKGPNVDIYVENPYVWQDIKTDSFDVVISGQAFEHTEFFWITISEMTRVLKKDGYLCIIAPNGFGEHRFPVDCYRFFTDGMVSMARYVSLKVLHAHTNLGLEDSQSSVWYSDTMADSMLVASKPYHGQTKLVDLKNYKCVVPDHDALRGTLRPKPLDQNQPELVLRKSFWQKVKSKLNL